MIKVMEMGAGDDRAMPDAGVAMRRIRVDEVTVSLEGAPRRLGEAEVEFDVVIETVMCEEGERGLG